MASNLPNGYDVLQDQAISTLGNGKVSKGGDADGATLRVGTVDLQSLQLISNNQPVVAINDLNVGITVDESIFLSTTNADFPSQVEVILGGNDMLIAKLTNPGEGTVELPYPSYDSWMNANSVCRKAYIDGEVQAAFAKWKAPVEAATVAPITNTNPGSSFTTAVTPSTWTILHGTTNLIIDGVTINAIGQRILIQFETSFLFS